MWQITMLNVAFFKPERDCLEESTMLIELCGSEIF